MLDLQLFHLRPDLEEQGVEIVETAHQRIPGLLASDLPPVFFGTAHAFPFNCTRVTCALSSLSVSTSMGESALSLGPALADSQTVLPSVELMSWGWEDRADQLTYFLLSRRQLLL